MPNRNLAVSGPQRSHFNPASLKSIQPRATHLQLHIKLTQMIGQDYVFLCTEQQIMSNKACQQQAFELCESLGLDKNRTEFVLVSSANDGEQYFQRCNIQWVDDYPVGITRKKIQTASQQDFYQTLFEHTKDICTRLL